MTIVDKTERVDRQVTYYVAVDGTTFANRSDCLEYEMKILRSKVFANVECRREADDYPPCNGGENMESHSYRWFRPRSAKDIDLLGDCFGREKFSYAEIGKWICVECFEDGECCRVTNLESSVEYAKELLGFFGYNLLYIPKELKYDVNCRRKVATVGEMKKLLAGVDDDAPFFCCGSAQPFVHISEDGDVISVDTEPLDEEYEG